MKTVWKVLAVSVVITFVLFKLFLSPKAKGTNVDVQSESKSTVYFYPVCPKCDHVSEMYQVNISKGESHKTIHGCEKCFYVYDVEIKR